MVEVVSHKVLVVEDNALHARLLKMMLSSFGYHVETAHDGHTALETLRSYCPDVIICDLMMDEVDGFELAGKIKSHSECHSSTLIATTACDSRFREAAMQSGFHYYLPKPINMDELQSILTKVLSEKVKKH